MCGFLQIYQFQWDSDFLKIVVTGFFFASNTRINVLCLFDVKLKPQCKFPFRESKPHSIFIWVCFCVDLSLPPSENTGKWHFTSFCCSSSTMFLQALLTWSCEPSARKLKSSKMNKSFYCKCSFFHHVVSTIFLTSVVWLLVEVSMPDSITKSCISNLNEMPGLSSCKRLNSCSSLLVWLKIRWGCVEKSVVCISSIEVVCDDPFNYLFLSNNCKINPLALEIVTQLHIFEKKKMEKLL